MKELKRLAVYLDEWADDKDVLAFAGRIALLAESESILCVYLQRHHPDAPGAVKHEQFVKSHLPAELHDRLTLEVHQTGAVDVVLKAARDQELDLVLAGRSLPSNQVAVGNAFNRLSRKAPCSVFLIPQDAHVHLSRVLVPVDFSEHSRLAIDAALDIARSSEEATPQVVVQTVFCVDYGYSKSGLTLEEASERMEDLARKRLAAFVADIDTSGVDFELVCSCSEVPEHAISDLAASRKMDMICVGSRGVTSSAVALLGGTAERIIAAVAKPVLIVKRKGETARLLDVLLGRG